MTGSWQWPAAGWIDRAEMLAIPAIEMADQTQLPSQPAVSVLMMTRNHADFLEQAVASVLAQRFDGSLELLIGEDKSSDSTLAVALRLQRQHPSMIRVFHAHTNVGIRSNFLRLVAHARAPLLALLEGDDYWTDTDKLALQCVQLEQHPEQVAVSAATANRLQWLPVKPAYGLQDLLRRYAVHTSTLVIRAEHLLSYPRFPDNVCWETMLLGYLMARGNCGYLHRTVSYYRRHHGGLWHNADRLRRLEMSWECIDSLDAYFFGKFRRELLDREYWIYRMDWRLPEKNAFQHWAYSWRILAAVTPRLAERSLFRLARFYLYTLFAPLPHLAGKIRGRLAIRSRLRCLRSH